MHKFLFTLVSKLSLKLSPFITHYGSRIPQLCKSFTQSFSGVSCKFIRDWKACTLFGKDINSNKTVSRTYLFTQIHQINLEFLTREICNKAVHSQRFAALPNLLFCYEIAHLLPCDMCVSSFSMLPCLLYRSETCTRMVEHASYSLFTLGDGIRHLLKRKSPWCHALPKT